jgi:hypothetical protein
MRKVVCLTMVALFFITIITGFAESHVHPGESGVHTVLAILLIVAAFSHALVNRKAFLKYFMGLGKKAE